MQIHREHISRELLLFHLGAARQTMCNTYACKVVCQYCVGSGENMDNADTTNMEYVPESK